MMLLWYKGADTFYSVLGVSMLVVGAGGLALWSLRMAVSCLPEFCDGKLNLTVADTSVSGFSKIVLTKFF